MYPFQNHRINGINKQLEAPNLLLPHGFFFLTDEMEGQIPPNLDHVESIWGGQSALWIKGHHNGFLCGVPHFLDVLDD